MNYSDNYFYKKLELDVIFDELKKYIALPNNISLLNEIEPYSDIEEIDLELSKVDEARIISTKVSNLPLYMTKDLSLLVSICEKGGIISPVDLFEFVRLFSSISAIYRLVSNIDKLKLEVPYFKEAVNRLETSESLEEIFRKTVDDNGNILDTASKELKRIRSQINNIEARIKSKVTEILNNSLNYLSDNVIVIRDGRYCLCVKSEYKNSFKGILRDSSQSKLTCYMEPLGVYELSNEKELLQNTAHEEENRIIKEMSFVIANNSEFFINNFNVFSNLDLIFAKACYSKTYDGYKPHVNDKGILNLLEARHPLLKVKKVIPNNLEFGKEYKGIVITGPNTGGKTVFLKTVGLLSLMVKFGLLIPASSESNVMIFDKILADIGDDQSISENLSTFSSHMKRLIDIVDESTPNSLALLDEIGSGTDPLEGASLGIAVLKHFIKNGINFIVTTHYSELKAFAYENEMLTNASMAFDESTNNPTYHLVIGKSGSSNAFKTAKRLGLKKEIIDDAFKINHKDNNEISKLIHYLEKEKDLIIKEKESLSIKEKELVDKINELDKKLAEFENNKKSMIKASKIEADKIINETIEKANLIIKELESLKNGSFKEHELINIKGELNTLDESIDLQEKPVKKEDHHSYVVGDQVFLPIYQQYGILSKKLKKDLWEVSVGNIFIKAKTNEFTFFKTEEKEKEVTVQINKSDDKHTSLRLDLRGMRYTEAEDALDKYINDLLVAGLKTATIIHGFGTGAIREMVQKYVEKSPYIDTFRYGGEQEGGYGVTVITLK